MLNRCWILGGILVSLAGCGEVKESPAPQRPAQVSKTGLSEQDVQLLYQVVKELPDQKPPAFVPITEVDLSADARAADLVQRWQREFRSAYHPDQQARMWSRDGRLRRAIEDHGLEPADLARILIRLSAAVVRDSLDPRLDLVRMSEQADRSLLSLCNDLDNLPQKGLSPAVYSGRHEFLVNYLKEATAYREFLRLIQSATPADLEVVQTHRDELRRLLPPAETISAFEKRLETQAVILPASHIQQQPVSRQ